MTTVFSGAAMRAVAALVFCPLLGLADELPDAGTSSASPSITPPVMLERVEPVYPEEARRQGLGGVVHLELLVHTDGSVGNVRVLAPAGFGFDQAAVEAAHHFRFQPATRDGAPAEAVVLFDQQFIAEPRVSAAAPGPEPTGPKEPIFETVVNARGPTSAASSSTVRNLDFDLRPKTSPNDVLRVVPGLLAVQHQGGGKADQLFLRGFDADHGTDVGVFFDGIPVNMPSHTHGQGFADLHWLIPEVLEHIDVVKGPYDVHYGDFSTAGAVNLVTRDSFDSSSVQVTAGSFPTLPNKALAQGRFVGIVAPERSSLPTSLHSWLAFESAYDEGPFVHPEHLQRYNLIAKLSAEAAPRLQVGALAEAYGSGWIGSGQIPSREVLAGRLDPFGSEDPSEGGLTERQMLVGFAHYTDDAQRFDATVYLTRYRLSLWNDFTFFFEDPIHGSEIEQDDARTISGARLSYVLDRKWGAVALRTSLGGEFRYDGIHVDRWDAESQNGDFRQRIGRHIDGSAYAFSGNNDTIDQANLAGYLEEDAIFTRWFRLLAGLRNDFFGFNVDDLGQTPGPGQPNTSGTRQFAVLSPKASAVISPVPDIWDIYLNYGTGFHTNMAQVALIDGATRSNPDGTSFVIHAIPRLYGGEIGSRLHLFNRVDLAAALWGSYLENETVFDADHSAFAPSIPTRRVGADLEARARLLPWLYLDFDLAQANATAVPDHGNGGAVALAPKLYMTGGVTIKRFSGIRAGLRFRYLGDRPAFDETSAEYQYFTSRTLPNGQPNTDYDPRRVIAQGYLIFDAYAAYRWRFIEVSLAVQNLFNRAWREAQFGNHSCTADETYNPANPDYSGSGNVLTDGSRANRCGFSYANDPSAGGADTRSGVTDVHYTPGVPLNVQLTLKAFF